MARLSPPTHRPKLWSQFFFAETESNEPVLGKESKKYIQQVLGTFLYYACAVDPTMLVALSAIASEQASPTRATMKKVDQFLDYAASQEQVVLTYEASDTVLAVHSDDSYLSESKTRSRADGHFFMSNDVSFPPQNGAVINIAQTMKKSCTRQHNQKLEICISMHAKLFQPDKASMKWDTANPGPQCKLTIHLLILS